MASAATVRALNLFWFGDLTSLAGLLPFSNPLLSEGIHSSCSLSLCRCDGFAGISVHWSLPISVSASVTLPSLFLAFLVFRVLSWCSALFLYSFGKGLLKFVCPGSFLVWACAAVFGFSSQTRIQTSYILSIVWESIHIQLLMCIHSQIRQ